MFGGAVSAGTPRALEGGGGSDPGWVGWVGEWMCGVKSSVCGGWGRGEAWIQGVCGVVDGRGRAQI